MKTYMHTCVFFIFLKENNKIAIHSMSEQSGPWLFYVRYEGYPEIKDTKRIGGEGKSFM
jgi:hypothetical protein